MRLWLAVLSLYGSGVGSVALNTSRSVLKGTGTSTGLLGNYVASGIGLESSDAGSKSSTEASGTSDPALRATSATTTISPSFASNGTSTSAYGTFPSPTWANTSLGLNQCWDEWSTYWDLLPSFSTFRETACISTSELMTYDTTIPYTITNPGLTPYTSTLIYTYTRTIDNNGFATSTYYRTEYNTITNTVSSPGTTYTTGASAQYTYVQTCDRAYSTSASLPSPSCTLPSSGISQCENAWDSWVNVQLTRPSTVVGTRTSCLSLSPAPSCTQASLAEESCSSLKDAFVSSSLDLSYFSKILPPNISTGTHGEEIHWSGGYYSSGGEDTWKWPPKTAFFGPSCMLGCGRCSIKGGTVDLLYWPPATSAEGSANHSAPTTTAEPLVITTMGTELTSPTLYVSYHNLYAENGCGEKIGTTIFDTIIAIPTASTLQSIWGSIGSYDEDETTDVYTSTAAFNISDLYHDKVPMSIYSSQPWCAKWAYFNLDQWAEYNSSSWSCPHTAPYKPIIKLPEDVLRAVDPAWADCVEAYGGVYDPPLALTPVSTVAAPTLPNQGPTTTPAAEASMPAPVTPVATTPRVTAVPVSMDPPRPSQQQPESPSSGDQDEGEGSVVPVSVDTGNLVEAVQSAIAAAQEEQSQEDPDDPTAQSTGASEVVIGTQTFTAAQEEGDVPVHGNAETTFAVSAGEAVTVGTHVVSAGPSGGLVTGTGEAASTLTAGTPVETQSPDAEMTIGSQVFTLESGTDNVFANADSTFTLDPGAATQVGTQIISAVPEGTAVVVGSGNDAKTIPIPVASDGNAGPQDVSTVATFEIDGEAYTAAVAGSSAFEVAHDGTTLAMDASVANIDGQVVTLGSGGVAMDGTTHAWSTMTVAPSRGVEMATFEIDGRLYTASLESGVAVISEGLTLTLGGTGTTIDGHSVSLASKGVVVDGTRNAWKSETTSSYDPGSSTSTRSAEPLRSSMTSSRSAAQEGTGPPSSMPTSGAASRWRGTRLLAISVFVFWFACAI